MRGKILPASDIYSFGILLWELFTGELIQDAIKDAPKVSSRLTMGSWRPVFTDDCPQVHPLRHITSSTINDLSVCLFSRRILDWLACAGMTSQTGDRRWITSSMS